VPSAKSEHIQIEEPAEGHRKTSANAPKVDTPLTMAMRKAGAEAAQKAGQKKALKPGSLFSGNPTSPDAPTPSTTTSTNLNKAFEEPNASADITAGKTPAVLAAEGVKRTSFDSRVAASESSTDTETEPSKSVEESLLQARRTSSIPKTQTPLSNETALESTSSLSEQQRFEERPRTHRGSSVSEASKEEIECVEKSNAIPEEDEDDEETPGSPRTSDSKAQTTTDGAKSLLADVASSDEQQRPSEQSNETRAQNTKGAASGVGVGD
jgi:hypothetical protein